MSADDEQARWLRDQLDRELADVHPRPDALAEVLADAQADRGHSGRGGPPAWFLAGAAVLVVALAVPVLRGTLFADPPERDRLASPSLSVDASSTVAPIATPRLASVLPPKVSPPPSRSVHRSTAPPTARATPTPSTPTCRPGSSPAPGAGVDLDGDGQPDAVSVTAGALTVTLTGSGTASTPFSTSSPYVNVLPVRTGNAPGYQLLVLTQGAIGKAGAVGEQGRLYAAQACAIAPVHNIQGKPYIFEVGSLAGDTERVGVSCAGGVLYGVTSVLGADGTWTVTRTPVSSASGRAVNGAPTTSLVAGDDPAVATLGSASCGDATPITLS